MTSEWLLNSFIPQKNFYTPQNKFLAMPLVLVWDYIPTWLKFVNRTSVIAYCLLYLHSLLSLKFYYLSHCWTINTTVLWILSMDINLLTVLFILNCFNFIFYCYKFIFKCEACFVLYSLSYKSVELRSVMLRVLMQYYIAIACC